MTVTGHAGTDLTLTGLSATNTLTFTTTTWGTAQTVTVTAGQDTDGADDAVTLTHTAAGGEYASVTATLSVTVVDNDRAIVLNKTALTVDEGDTSGATYTVKLATQPSETVTVAVTGQSGTDLTLDKTTLTFTTTTWNTAQTVTVTARQDADGFDDSVTLTHTAAGGNYAGETAELAVTVTDDETVAVVISKSALSVTEEDTSGETYTVKLSHLPSEHRHGDDDGTLRHGPLPGQDLPHLHHHHVERRPDRHRHGGQRRRRNGRRGHADAHRRGRGIRGRDSHAARDGGRQ